MSERGVGRPGGESSASDSPGILSIALVATLASCAASPAPVGRVGSTIVLLTTGELAVANPDQGSISFVDPGSLQTLATVATGGDPTSLLQDQSGSLWVATHSGGELVRIDPSSRSVTSTTDVCQGPAGLASSPDGSWIAVACEYSGQVLQIGSTTTTLASGLLRPRSLAVVGQSIVVGQFTTGGLIEIDPTGHQSSISLVPSSAPYRPALTQMTSNLAAQIVPAFGHLFVPHELVNHTGDTSAEPVADDYGSVPDGTPKINAAVTRLALSGEIVSAPADTPPVYTRFDVPLHAFCGPVAAAPFGDRYLLVAHVSTNDVAVLDTTSTSPDSRLVGVYETGAGPSGIAVDAAASVAYVDNALDGSISRIDLTQLLNVSAPVYAAQQTQVRSLPSPYSEAALAGRHLFFDATNTHVTPSRVVACATCHPAGADDGLVWFIHTPTIPLKRRRTPHLTNSRSETAPFHWNGQFATMTDLVSATITDLMAGDGLLVDPTTVQHYVDEIVIRPTAPEQDLDAVARGKALFESPTTGCTSCHTGPEMTDGLEHPVLNPPSLTADDVFTAANTPDLHGLFYRAPYFHDARSPSLEDLLTRPDAAGHGLTSGLSPTQLSDLAAFLRTL